VTSSFRQACGAALFYLVATCAVTWPLIAVVDRRVAADMGDPLLNCWILLWTGGQVLAFLSGDTGALPRFWHGNIFHPEPLTIAYSEHLAPQMLQALPVLAATDNVILAYNLLIISTFVLSGLGTFLLVRDLTGRPLAALIAGLAFAFAPYRFDQLSHVQVLSSQWMPFALYGLRRYLDTGRSRALLGGGAALIAQNLSCGYYLLFFTPFVVAYVVYELASRQRLRDWKTWRAILATGVLVAVVTLPFLTPYLEVRSTGVGVRSMADITRFSADVHAFATAPSKSWLWGDRLATFPRGEGVAFPGIAILTLALIGIAGGVFRRPVVKRPLPAPWRQFLIGVLSVLLVAHLYAFFSVLITGRFAVAMGGVWVLWLKANRVIAGTIIITAALALLLRRPRDSREPGWRWPWAFYAVAAAAAAILAMGPNITVQGTIVASGPYAWLMDYVPGFDGLRVPARYVMLVTLCLAVLAGLGASDVLARSRRFGAAFLVVAGALILVESWPREFETNARIGTDELNLTPEELQTGRRIPPIYKAIRDHEPPVTLLEFPFGSPAWDLYAVFYAGYHRRPLVNGYSGFFPEGFQRLAGVLNVRRQDPVSAWNAVLGSGATHVLVHEAAYPAETRTALSDWLTAAGAREILADGPDRLFAVR
jgi:hypothetical protein